MRKSSPVFLLPSDEEQVAHAVRARHPAVKLIDGPHWPTETPPAVDDIGDCRDSIVLIWETSLCPRLPTYRSPHGYFEGPQSGVVVQWRRNRLHDDGRLEAGSWGYGDGPDTDPQILDFVRSLWRILFKSTANRLARAGDYRSPPLASPIADSRYRIGPAALAEADAGRLILVDELTRLIPLVSSPR